MKKRIYFSGLKDAIDSSYSLRESKEKSIIQKDPKEHADISTTGWETWLLTYLPSLVKSFAVSEVEPIPDLKRDILLRLVSIWKRFYVPDTEKVFDVSIFMDDVRDLDHDDTFTRKHIRIALYTMQSPYQATYLLLAYAFHMRRLKGLPLDATVLYDSTEIKELQRRKEMITRKEKNFRDQFFVQTERARAFLDYSMYPISTSSLWDEETWKKSMIMVDTLWASLDDWSKHELTAIYECAKQTSSVI